MPLTCGAAARRAAAAARRLLRRRPDAAGWSETRETGRAAAAARGLLRRAATAAAAGVVLGTATAAAAGEPAGPGTPATHRVVILAYDTNDVRLPMALDAVAFWNEVAAELGLPLRLDGDVRIASPITRTLENYARSISQRAGRLRGGPGEPDAPAAITDLGAEAVLLLSRQDLMSFAWPIPQRPGHFVAIEEDRTAMATNPNIARNIIAHEIGHTLGLRHNRDPTTLMCGPCRTNELASDRPEYMRLTARDRQRLVARYGVPAADAVAAAADAAPAADAAAAADAPAADSPAR